MVSDTISDPNLSRMRWRCRRGMRELDRILEGFVDKHYDALSAPEKLSFAEFLELPDPDLHAYLIGKAEPMDSDLARLLRRIRASLAP
jgi:antitoxin CptB